MTHVNPWKELDLKREQRFGGGHLESLLAIQQIQASYRDVPGPIGCVNPGCTEQMFWRVTVGAFQCRECNSLAGSRGNVIKIDHGRDPKLDGV